MCVGARIRRQNKKVFCGEEVESLSERLRRSEWRLGLMELAAVLERQSTGQIGGD